MNRYITITLLFFIITSCSMKRDIDKNGVSEYFSERMKRYYDFKDYSGSIQEYSKMIENKINVASAYRCRGIVKHKIQDYKGAIQDFTSSIEIDSEFSFSYYCRGNSKAILQDFKGALSDFNKAIEYDNYTGNYMSRGVTKYALYDYHGAIKDFTKVIDSNPKDADAYYWRGLSRYQSNDKQHALEDLSLAGELGINKAYDIIKRVQK